MDMEVTSAVLVYSGKQDEVALPWFCNSLWLLFLDGFWFGCRALLTLKL